MLSLAALGSCKKFLDIVPDDVATIENAFTMRTTAMQYLYTCYSYMPQQSSPSNNPGFVAGDEYVFLNTNRDRIARGNQSMSSPYLDYWSGASGGQPLFEAINDCNTFLDNIGKVPDMEDWERKQWAAEVMFLKAYYQFYLLRMYGPIPLMKKNIPITASAEELKVKRQPVDSCFDYIIQLIDSAENYLPLTISNPTQELGRITLPIALAMKAKILVYAASPLFNGNPDYATFTDQDGKPFFNPVYDPSKWTKAAEACKEAIDACTSAGNELYYYNQSITQYNVSPEITTQMNIRNSLCEKWNKEVIWANTQSMTTSLQNYATPRGLDPAFIGTNTLYGDYSIPLKIIENFYSKNGVPITEDKDWDYSKRFDLSVVPDTDRYEMIPGYTTANLNFDREPRFYADLAFDGAIWYGQGRYTEDSTKPFWTVEGKLGQAQSRVTNTYYAISGYLPKKVVNYTSVIGNSYTVTAYPWPILRLADLYLLYAEALNESNDAPVPEIYTYLNMIRARAGLNTIQESWDNHSTNPLEYTTKDGLRKIIHQERCIELAFEGQRFWDILRWKESVQTFNGPITGWDVDQSDVTAYYKEKVLYTRSFKLRDYFWPISQNEIIHNSNLIQNPGW